MNLLLAEMKRSLAELDLGLKGDLTISEPMERLMHALASDAVPASWRNLAYPSLRPLGSWLVNLLQRCQQLTEWAADLGLPKVCVVCVGGGGACAGVCVCVDGGSTAARHELRTTVPSTPHTRGPDARHAPHDARRWCG
jgi:hypothetical protein